MGRMQRWGWILGAIVVASIVVAGGLVDQGKPGIQGPWPVTCVSGCNSVVTIDGGLTIATVTQGPAWDGGLNWNVAHYCLTRSQSVASVGTSASTLAVNLTSRWYTRVCNSAENSGVPLVKCRDDGTNPVMGIANAGEVLEVGDCVTYYTTVGIRCISDSASIAVSQSECQ